MGQSQREFPIKIADRKFVLKELNGKRRDQIDDLFDRAKILAKQLDEAEDIEKRRELRLAKKEIDFDTYRVFLIPSDPPEKTPNEWFNDHLSEGYFTHVVCELQGGLNRYENMAELGKSIKEKLAASETSETLDLSVGPTSAAP